MAVAVAAAAPPLSAPADPARAVMRPGARIIDRGAVAVLRRLAALLLGGALSLAAAEIGLRLSGVERRGVNRALYYQGADIALHEVSPDPRLLYELKPGATGQSDAGGVGVRVDRFGARGPDREPEKADGVYRILMFGASTLYGAGLEEADTMAAVLERQLDADVRGGGAGADESPVRDYEVWNFGVSGYALPQMVARARSRLPLLGPDLIVILYSNHTRRPFLVTTGSIERDHGPWLRADADLFVENFPVPEGVSESMHVTIGRRSALYRYARALDRTRKAGPRERGNDRTDAIGDREVRGLEAEAIAAGFAPVYAVVPAWRGKFPREQLLPSVPADRVIDLFEAGHPEGWHDDHPPPAIMAEHTKILFEALKRGGHLGRPAGREGHLGAR